MELLPLSSLPSPWYFSCTEPPRVQFLSTVTLLSTHHRIQHRTHHLTRYLTLRLIHLHTRHHTRHHISRHTVVLQLDGHGTTSSEVVEPMVTPVIMLIMDTGTDMGIGIMRVLVDWEWEKWAWGRGCQLVG
jgi:hypothetical protein